MLGFSFSEVVLIGIVALVAVGPQKLPGMLKTFGAWMRKLRKLTTEVRAQTGIDDILRAEGIHGGITELRSLMRGGAPAPATTPYRAYDDPYRQVDVDLSREYPPEGADAKGALPDDLTGDDDEDEPDPVVTVVKDHTPPEPAPEAAAPAPEAAAPEPAPVAEAAAPEPAAVGVAETAAPEPAPAIVEPAAVPPADPAAAAPSPPAADAAAPAPAEPAKPVPEAQT